MYFIYDLNHLSLNGRAFFKSDNSEYKQDFLKKMQCLFVARVYLTIPWQACLYCQ